MVIHALDNIEYLTVKEFANLEGLLTRTIRKRISSGHYKKVILVDTIGGNRGKKYQIHFSELSPKAKLKYFNRQRDNQISPDKIQGIDQDSAHRALKLRQVIHELKLLPRGQKSSRLLDICKEFRISKTTLRQVIKEYESTGSLNAFFRKKRLDNNQTKSFSSEALEILVEDYCKTLNKKDAYKKMVTECVIHGWTYGSYGSACRWLYDHVDKNPAMTVYLEQGRKGLEDKAVPSLLRDYSDLECNEYICGDHHQLDIFIHNGNRVYRPWITAWQDMKSRAIVGYAVCDIPNSRSIAQALQNSIKYKDKRRHYGVPQNAYIDNGKDYRSYYISGGRWQKKKNRLDYDIMTKTVMAQLGIEPVYCLPYNAKSKPIERLFYTLEKQLIKQLSGYCGNSPQNRPVHELVRQLNNQELLTLDEFRNRLDQWIEEYHDSSHKARDMKGRSPNQIWDEATENGWAPIVIESDEILQLLFMMSKERTVRRHGVQIHNEFYYHESLLYYLKEKVEVRWDPADLSEVHIFQSNIYICTAYPYPRLSMKTPHAELGERIRAKRRMVKMVEDQYRYLTGGKTKIDNTKGAGNFSKALKNYSRVANEMKQQKEKEEICKPQKNTGIVHILPPDGWLEAEAEKERRKQEESRFVINFPEDIDEFKIEGEQ